jgi:hypothetical protein
MRTDVQKQIVSQLLSQKKYDGIREYLQVMFGQNDVVFESYDGLRPRLFKDEDEHIVMLLPNDMDTVMEGAVVDSIKDGTIFDDANVVNNTAKYIRMTTLPYNGLMNKNIDEPKALVSAVGSVVGTMNDEGRFGSEDSDLENGVNAMRDLMDHSNDEPGAPIKLVANYIDLKKNGEIPRSYRRSLAKIGDEVKDIDSVDIDDTIGPDDYRELKLTDECGSACAPVEEDAENISNDEDCGDDEETDVKEIKEDAGNIAGEDDDKVKSIKEEDDVTDGTDTNATSDTSTSSTTTDTSATSASSDTTPEEVESSYSNNGTDNADVQQEGFLTKKPKRLKPIPRDTIAYITVELNAIKDSNDQAMLAGYTCSKLELVDFYLNCIDTQDDRYIVPHTRQYLVQMQNELNALLIKILQVRPMNKMDRIWKPGVTLPDNVWR